MPEYFVSHPIKGVQNYMVEAATAKEAVEIIEDAGHKIEGLDIEVSKCGKAKAVLIKP